MAISASAHESMLGGPRGPDDSERIPPATSGLIYDSGSMSETSASSMSETGASSISEDSDASSISMSEQARRRGERMRRGERAQRRGERVQVARRAGAAARRASEMPRATTLTRVKTDLETEGRGVNRGSWRALTRNGFGNR